KGAFIKNPPALPALAGLDCLLLPMEALCCEEDARLSEVFDGEKTVDLSVEHPEKDALRVLRYGIISTGLYGTERLALKHQRSENVYTIQQEALLEAGQRYEVYSKKLEEDYPIFDHLDKGENGSLFETTLVHYKGQDVVVLRGDPEKVLERCTGYYKEGKILQMDEGVRKELNALAAAFSRNNRQPVAVATKNHRYNNLLRISDAQTDLIFEGFLAIEKPFLQGAAKELIRMRHAGIKVLVYCKEEGAENRHLARALGVCTRDSQIVRRSDLADMGEEIYKINLKNYTLFEGFDSTALGYTVTALKEEYGYRVGVLGNELSAVSLLYRADVFFASEEGDRLMHLQKEEQTVTDPVWAKTGSDTGRVGCQALGTFSDVIVPTVDSESGEGGINGVATAIRAARSIYRNIGTLLFYLAFGGAMRLAALLFSMGGSFYLSPVQSLVLGLIFDLLAVFVIARHKPGVDYPKMGVFKGQEGLARKVLRLLPAISIGALLSAGTVFLANVLEQNALLHSDGRSAFVFCALLFLQSAMLTVLLSSHLPFKKGRGAEPLLTGYFAAVLLWLLFCFLVPGVSAVTGICFVGWPCLLLSLLPATVFFLGALVVRYVLHKKK
ncbi:MAG: cation-transporting P-type ATPase, partial [Clostridia bacterium]|nr:cation-transporting P-type ATPase [Clostridia bacterium]